MPASIYDVQAVDAFRVRRKLDPWQIHLLRKSLFKNFRSESAVWDAFPWSQELQLHPLELRHSFDSQLDGATKLIFATPSGMLIESVILRIDTGRTTLCISSQVGCGAACDFCATGKMGVAIDLSASEILDQVLRAGQQLGQEERKLRNIVFMGMGEPFHNEEHVFTAVELLLSREYFHHPAKRILISTVGVADAMLRCVRRFPSVGLALSLHSARQEIREQIIPLAKKFSLCELRETVARINSLQANPVMIEYLMLDQRTDTAADVDALLAWLEGLRVHVNLIPFNSVAESNLVGTSRPRIDAFAARLKHAGYKTTVRYSLGSDIGAACGQLVQQENRRLARELAKSRQG